MNDDAEKAIERARSLVPVEGQPTCKVTFGEWCELVGTTTGAMAEAQERAEAEDWGEELKREAGRKEMSDGEAG